MAVPQSDFMGPDTKELAPGMDSNEALRRILWFSKYPAKDVNGNPVELTATPQGLLNVNLAGGDINLTVSDSITVAGRDESLNPIYLQERNHDPLSNDYGLITRNIPSGTQAISAASLPLPSGAATEATVAGLATQVTAASIDSKLPSLVAGRIPVDGSGVTQPISVSSLPLPTGASTSANQATEIASLSSIDGKTPSLVSGRVPVDGSAVTQPVSAISLPLPTGAATESTLSTASGYLTSLSTNQTNGAQKTQITDSLGNSVAIPSAGVDGASNTANTIRTTSNLSAYNGSTWDRIRSGITGAISSFVGYINTLPVARYLSSPPTLTNGQGNELTLTSDCKLRVDVAGQSVTVSGVATETTLGTVSTRIGDLTESAPGTDTASSGLNGRLQRISQRLSSLIAFYTSSAGNGSVTTSGTGSSYVTLSSQACHTVTVFNTSGADIEVLQGGAGVSIPIYADVGQRFKGLTNATNLSVRRLDQSNTQVTLQYRWEA